MKNDNKMLLTTELYETLTANRNEEIIKLKQEQGSLINDLSDKNEVLQNMKISYGQLRVNIREFKKEIRSEKRKLKRTNKSLCLVKNALSRLNRKFISDKNQFIKVKKKIS